MSDDGRMTPREREERKAVESLIEAFSRPHTYAVRESFLSYDTRVETAAKSLAAFARLGNRQARETLIAVLQEDSGAEVKENFHEAVYALGLSGCKEAVEPLLIFVKINADNIDLYRDSIDRSDRSRYRDGVNRCRQGIKALGLIGAVEALEPLRELQQRSWIDDVSYFDLNACVAQAIQNIEAVNAPTRGGNPAPVGGTTDALVP